MMLHLTKVDAVFKHRILWCAVAEKLRQLEGSGLEVSLEKIKEDVIDTRFSKMHPPEQMCFMCDYAIETTPSIFEEVCGFCPLMKSSSLEKNEVSIGACLDGLYAIVGAEADFGNFAKASETALEIAFLPLIN